MFERIVGRVAAADIVNPDTGEVIAARDEIIGEAAGDLVEKLSIEEVFVRSPLTCEMVTGLCALCYGRDLGRGDLVEIGSAVGIVAAQSICGLSTQVVLLRSETSPTVCRAWRRSSRRARSRAARR
jgi:DNA-directed RNA polymerase subunit beta'